MCLRLRQDLELVIPETMKLHVRTDHKITKDKNNENTSNLEINEVMLFHCNIVNHDYQQYSRVFIHLLQINDLVNY